MRTFGVWFACCLAAAVVTAQEPAAGELKFAKSYEEAFTRAKAEKKPVLFCIMKDNEIACKRMLGTVYKNPGVRKKMAEFVLVPCSISPEPTFEGVRAVEHQACERAMREAYQAENLVIAPQHIVVDPEGKLLLKKAYELNTGKFLEFLDRGLLYFADPARATTESRPAGEEGAAGGRSAEVERILAMILKAAPPEKERLIKDLMSDPSSAERQEACLEALKKTTDAKVRGGMVRALGYPEFSGAAPMMVKVLEEKDTFVRNCATVTLEEMANPAAAEALVALHKREKDAEIKKDSVRALGPCGGGKPEVRDLLLKELTATAETMRTAAAMSLGMFVAGDDAVRKAYVTRYPKESLKVKTAILWGLGLSGDIASAEIIKELMKDESNGQLKELAGLVRKQLGDDEAPEADEGGDANGKKGRGGRGGGGRVGGGRRGGAGGGPGTLYRLLAPLYQDDKIMRNRVKEFMNLAGGR
jgi:HEAT repeat protein